MIAAGGSSASQPDVRASQAEVPLSQSGARNRAQVQWAVNRPSNVETPRGPATLGSASTWNLLLRIWPLEDRPDEMTDPAVVASLSFDQLMEFKKHYEALTKREGKGEGVFGKDSAIPSQRFEAGEDNCAEILHPAR